MGVEKVLLCGFCTLWFTNDAEVLFLCLLLVFLSLTQICVCVCALLVGLQKLFLFCSHHLSVVWIAHIFSKFVVCLFPLRDL